MSTGRIDAACSAVVLVDYQQRLLPAIHRGEQVIGEALLLADVALELGLVVIGTEQNPAGLGPNDERVSQRCASTLAKMHFDACEDGLLQALPEGPDGAPIDVVIAGCEAHVCLMQTALGLRRAGHAVWVVAPACGSRRPEDHALAMQRLAGAGAVIVSSEMVAFEWLHSCRHERFKPVLQRLKAPRFES
ncbi:MAG: isochorismatase family protein [Methylibium sp.]|nr:isochorismatase family protein [Methylibium sp.]